MRAEFKAEDFTGKMEGADLVPAVLENCKFAPPLTTL
jgi:hypothetical protein